ncbi:ImmA/IrrE family metallo-endopeptidase [Corynebacterium pygosceleis]|uniref:ImmA/IrrE family metallo-endopeptidase n=1 Tax=Corynebacterium pygosceleis TaxID=2800406 RepID=UPI002004D4E5|nr:ImmA/IrrE family metallo-endopeptidase [Corynebacterium pygosceleis]MCK7676204.1 ImmA/IrrE family metallo-endopeptidase [Corynebacterium pygosceleis]
MATVTVHDLESLAEDLGVLVSEHNGGAEVGRWYPARRVITIRRGLHPVEQLCTLAHELGHAYLEHQPGVGGWFDARQEREADEYAARMLIAPAEYALAETMYGPDARAIAAELGVTPHLVETWRGLHTCGKFAA